MSEVVNVVVALAVIVFVVRWATSSRETPEERNVRSALGFRPKTVTPDMLETISVMFPDMPKENIHYDLLRTGNVEVTTNKIIERGFLDPPPPAYFRIYPRLEVEQLQRQQPSASQSTVRGPDTSTATSSSGIKSGPSLISRYNLEDRLSARSGSGIGEEEGGNGGGGVVIDSPEQAGGKAAWEATPERREASLRERKAQMILAARKRMLEQQKAAGAGASSSGSGVKTK